MIPGDGVGPDVVGAARAVVEAAGVAFGFAVDWSEHLAGGASIDAHQVAIRPEDVDACGAADAILLGAVGGPKWSDPTAPVRETVLTCMCMASGSGERLRKARGGAFSMVG